MDKYFIKINNIEKEVTKQEFIEMEQSCGFYPKEGLEIATGGFAYCKGSIDIRGRVEFNCIDDFIEKVVKDQEF